MDAFGKKTLAKNLLKIGTVITVGNTIYAATVNAASNGKYEEMDKIYRLMIGVGAYVVAMVISDVCTEKVCEFLYEASANRVDIRKEELGF